MIAVNHSSAYSFHTSAIHDGVIFYGISLWMGIRDGIALIQIMLMSTGVSWTHPPNIGVIPQTTTLKIVYWKKAWSLTSFLFDKVWGFLGANSPSWPMAAQFSDKCICKSAKESWPALLEQKASVCQKPFLPISGPQRYNKLECINNRVTKMAKIDFQYNAMKYHMVYHCA